MPDLATMVAVAGFSMLAAVINPIYCVVPLGMALIFPTDAMTAALTGAVLVYLMGNLIKALNIR
jgi:hypothetical protein